MLPRVIFGNRFDFKRKNGFTLMFVNGIFEGQLPASGNIERDAGILMMGYAE